MTRVLVFAAALLITANAALAQNSTTASNTCTVAGRVVKASSGEPLKAARVVLLDSEAQDEQHSYHAVTDANGAFVLNGVLPGRYRFAATRTGYVPQAFKAKAAGSEGAILTLEAGQQLTEILFRLVRTAALVGRVTDEDGEPVAGVEVQAMVKASPEDERDAGAIQVPHGELVPATIGATNDLGEFRLYGLPPGDYYISAIDSGSPELSDYAVHRGAFGYERGNEPMTNHPPMYYPGVFQRSQAQSVAVRAGEEVRVEFSLRPAKTITVSGHVVGPDGKAAVGAFVMVEPRDVDTMFTSMRNSAQVDAEGRFRVEGITPGSYVLSASQLVDQKQYSAERKIETGNDDIANIELGLRSPVTVRGRVLATSPGAFAQRDVHVWLNPADQTANNFGAADVNKDGTFRIDQLAEGSYRVNVTGLVDGWYLKSARFGMEDALEHGVRVSRGAVSPLLELSVSPNASQVQGIVVQAGNPVAGADVQLRPETDNPNRKDLRDAAKTDQYGHFVLKNIPPGRYLISASIDDEEGGTAKAEPQKLSLRENEKKSIKLEMPSQNQ
jgi:hypothetical protein